MNVHIRAASWQLLRPTYLQIAPAAQLQLLLPPSRPAEGAAWPAAAALAAQTACTALHPATLQEQATHSMR
jgi:hypothetical protein